VCEKGDTVYKIVDGSSFPYMQCFMTRVGVTCPNATSGVFTVWASASNCERRTDLQHVDSHHKRNLIFLHYEATRLIPPTTSSQIRGGKDGSDGNACLIRYTSVVKRGINVVFR
jgi:hypothetical protein